MNTPSALLTIRDATPGDVDLLAGYNAAMALETEDVRLEPEIVQAGVAALIDKPAGGFYLVAERDGKAVGSLMVTFEWSDWRNGQFWWLQSVFVAPAARRQGVFTQLVATLTARAQAARDSGEQICGLRLYVYDGNEGARRTYETLGFEQTHYRLFERIS